MAIVIPEKSARDVIEESFELQTRMKIPQIVYNAYTWSYRLVENTSVLKWMRGESLIPYIKNIAVEFYLIQEIKEGNLPLKWRISHNSNKSASFVDFYTDNLLLHVNQVRNKSNIAREAFCRDQYIQPFQSYFDFDGKDQIINLVNEKPQYFQLNHGYQSMEPLFISLGIPGSNRKWIDDIPLIEEFAVFDGRYPTSKVEDIKEFSLEEFQQFTEEVEKHNERQSTES